MIKQLQSEVSPLQEILHHPGASQGVRLFVKRDDLLHAVIQGNKWRKLQPVIKRVLAMRYKGIITFGGAFSNHIEAVSAAGRIFDIPTFGVIRGEHADLDNPTLSVARANGMMLFPVPKKEYDFEKERIAQELLLEFPKYCVLPEGGATPEAVDKCANITWELSAQLRALDIRDGDCPLRFAVPMGTGATAAGMVAGLPGMQASALIFPADRRFVNDAVFRSRILAARPELRDWLDKQPCAYQYVVDYDYGGFARRHPALIPFHERFVADTGIRLDPVYTLKMFMGLYDMLAAGAFEPGSVVVGVHTGGLQGWAGFEQAPGRNAATF
ncbi:MAG: 1-aminocyclopropane-1-carboxylate deaminase/D-cysteine desulfhydrase [Saprospiraceae bacterium]